MQNLVSQLRPTNQKLWERGLAICALTSPLGKSDACSSLKATNFRNFSGLLSCSTSKVWPLYHVMSYKLVPSAITHFSKLITISNCFRASLQGFFFDLTFNLSFFFLLPHTKLQQNYIAPSLHYGQSDRSWTVLLRETGREESVNAFIYRFSFFNLFLLAYAQVVHVF